MKHDPGYVSENDEVLENTCRFNTRWQTGEKDASSYFADDAERRDTVEEMMKGDETDGKIGSHKGGSKVNLDGMKEERENGGGRLVAESVFQWPKT
jgi:hypothetical protein